MKKPEIKYVAGAMSANRITWADRTEIEKHENN